MHTDLTDREMNELLDRQLYGHLGCIMPEGNVYVVPITYAHANGCVYSFSETGTKVEAMRQHPEVCLQVEEFVDEGIWKSVILWGSMEELHGEERSAAMKALFDRLERQHGTPISPLYRMPAESFARHMKAKSSVFYRIPIERKTGKQIRYD